MKKIFLYSILSLLCFSCSNVKQEVPETYETLNEVPEIFPDYRDIVVPSNIAPLNFKVKSIGSAFAGKIVNQTGIEIVASSSESDLSFDQGTWREFLRLSAGQTLTVQLYAQRSGKWYALTPYTIEVAQERIDQYLSYRLIEPSYELYRQLGLYQRDLTNFDEYVIYENNSDFSDDHNHCINCHNYQNHDTSNMLFHVRGSHGGTIFVRDGKITKMNMKSDSILSNAVYPTWHPQKSLVAFSSNNTGQVFHLKHKDKIEVVDYASDLIIYNAETQEVSNILKTSEYLETFPCWAPDGRKLYFCRAYTPELAAVPDSIRPNIVSTLYDSLRYDVMSLTYDVETGKVDSLKVEVECASMGKSAAVPRISPDGRYLLFTVGSYGQFHIWHADADLYVKDMLTGQVRRLDKASAPGPDSYHAWSSNGRWLVVASRRDDGSYSRPYIAYFDKEGKDHKAFLLPLEKADHHLERMKSYNVPEFSVNQVSTTPESLKDVIYDDEHVGKVMYK
ncbi:MAG: PD40 domain-containing protein [Bacteroidaceae bacterium]|nr:PD40 domain-containing protein [Bacteroidaceae bacterium]